MGVNMQFVAAAVHGRAALATLGENGSLRPRQQEGFSNGDRGTKLNPGEQEEM